MMRNVVEEDVRCLVLPLADGAMLVPNTCVAEIAPFSAPSASPDSGPDWLLGAVEWRGLKMPLVSFEVMRGGEMPGAGGRARIAVFNSVGAVEDAGFYGVLLQDIPRLQRIAADELSTVASGKAPPFVIADASVGGQVMCMPDLDAVERAVAKVQL